MSLYRLELENVDDIEINIVKGIGALNSKDRYAKETIEGVKNVSR